MKFLYLLLGASVITVLMASCAGNNGLQEKAPVTIEEAYYISNGEEITFYLPVISLDSNKIELKEVYFRNNIANLVSSPDNPNVYSATFRTAKSDIIMSSNPKDEYWNKVPQKREKINFDLKDDEAVLIFTKNSNVKYFKLTGVKEKV